MCEITTTTMLVSSLVMSALSTGVGMYAQSEQQRAAQKAANDQAEYNSAVAAEQQATQEQLAQNEVAKGISDRDRFLRNASRQQGETASMMGASGFAMDSGSALSLLGESAEEAQYDADIISQNANMAAWGHQVGATSAINDQSMFAYQKANSGSGKTASMIGMGSTLLGGIANGMYMYSSAKKAETGKNDPFKMNDNYTYTTYSGVSGLKKP